MRNFLIATIAAIGMAAGSVMATAPAQADGISIIIGEPGHGPECDHGPFPFNWCLPEWIPGRHHHHRHDVRPEPEPRHQPNQEPRHRQTPRPKMHHGAYEGTAPSSLYQDATFVSSAAPEVVPVSTSSATMGVGLRIIDDSVSARSNSTLAHVTVVPKAKPAVKAKANEPKVDPDSIDSEELSAGPYKPAVKGDRKDHVRTGPDPKKMYFGDDRKAVEAGYVYEASQLDCDMEEIYGKAIEFYAYHYNVVVDKKPLFELGQERFDDADARDGNEACHTAKKYGLIMLREYRLKH